MKIVVDLKLAKNLCAAQQTVCNRFHGVQCTSENLALINLELNKLVADVLIKHLIPDIDCLKITAEYANGNSLRFMISSVSETFPLEMTIEAITHFSQWIPIARKILQQQEQEPKTRLELIFNEWI